MKIEDEQRRKPEEEQASEMNLPKLVGSIPVCPTHLILLGPVLFSSSAGSADCQTCEQNKRQTLARQTSTQAEQIWLKKKARMLPEKWRNKSCNQLIIITDLTSCKDFALAARHTSLWINRSSVYWQFDPT